MVETLEKNDLYAVMWGDTHLLDECAQLTGLKKLQTLHPLNRHQRILNALDRSPLFVKYYIPLQFGPYDQTRDVRLFYIKGREPK